MINYVRRATLFSERTASHTSRDAQAEDIKICDLKKPLNEGNKQLKLAKNWKERWQNDMHNCTMQQNNQSN
jgi:hypothetical protein